MELRGTLVFLFLLTTTARADEILKPTVVTDSAVDDMANRQTTRPTQVITQDKLQTDKRPLSDGLNTLPGVQSRLQGSPTITIRGSSSSSQTLVFADGAPLNFADGVGYNPIFVATENLDEVLLLRGPASSLFGHDALAGALEFNSEKLQSPKFYESYGSFNTFQSFAGAPIKIGDTHLQVTAYQTHSDGDYPYSISRTQASGTRLRNDSETVRATVSASNDSSEIFKWKTYNLIARQIGSTPDSVTENPVPSAFNNWAELTYLAGSLKLAEGLRLASRSTFKYLRQSYAGSSPSDTQSFRQGLSIIKTLGASEIEVFDDLSLEAFRADYFTGGQNTFTLNEIGASDLTSIGESLTIQPAFRISNESGGVVPSLGVSDDLGTGLKLYAQYAQGFHPPSLTELYSQSPYYVGNTRLLPEISTEYDLGLQKKSDFDTLNFEVFYRDISNLIQTQLINASTSMPVNVGHARAMGADLSAEHNGYVKTGINLDYLYNVELDTDSPIPLSPKVQASVFLGRSFGPYSLKLQDTYWTDYYGTSYPGNSLVDISAWNTVDFFIDRELTKTTNIKLSALNIFNQPRELTLNYPEPQQSFSVMLQGYL